MKLLQILKQWLLEKKGDTYESGCAMLYFNLPEMKKVHKMIDPEDIYQGDGSDGRTYGLEDEPHITLLFGLDPSVELGEVQDIIQNNHTYYAGGLKNASLFKSEDKPYEVLKFDVDEDLCRDLSKINEQLKELPYKNEFPDYHPHCTIAYLNKGAGDKYVEKLKDMKISIIPTKAVYSEASGEKHDIYINVD